MNNNIIYTRYENAVVVKVIKDKTKQYDYSGSSFGDLSASVVDKFSAGKELEIVGQAEHPLGYVFLCSEYAFAGADIDGQPHKPWGVLATQVKQVRVIPKPIKRKLLGGIINKRKITNAEVSSMSDKLVEQPSAAPSRKVGAGLTAGVVVGAIVTLLGVFGIIVPENVSNAAITLLVAVPVLVQFAVAYFTKSRKSEV